MPEVKWSTIEAECGDFRAGFIAVFRKYEGQPTDERTKQGRVVNVTAASFARHVGVEEKTFQVWLRKERGRAPRPRDRTRESVNRMSAKEKVELATEMMEGLDEDARLNIAMAATEPERRDDRRSEKERRAHRESKPGKDRSHLELIKNSLQKVDIELLSAIHTAKDTTWTPEGTEMAEARIDQTGMRLDLLRMAVKSDVDIDAALAELTNE